MTRSYRIARILASGLTLSALAFFWWLMFEIVAPYTSGRTDIEFLLSKQRIIHLSHYRWSFYLHIFSSLWVLGAGLTQFSSYILQKSPHLHRFIGKVYVGIILFISGPAGLLMAFYANGGLAAKLSFITLSIFWWFATLMAWKSIQAGDVRQHGAWMIRSYALTLSAITLRAMQYVLATTSDLHPEAAYTLIAWPSWILNWFLAECFLAWPGWFNWFYRK